MKRRYLLDTNILSDLVRHPQGKVAERIASLGENRMCTSIVVAAELRFGARKRGSDRLTKQLEAILSALQIEPLEEPADRHYGELRSYLEKQGDSIGPNDLLIAAHALSLECVLITANVKEFSRVPGLLVENWLES
ncbi:MAG: type II toxin-antitoxin system VapC family toxin [Gammaproteobacteria bacterium]|nr:type II toxin-antitoxin system VapC family toxin [Gammaproteobacteria bacterium]